MQKWVAGILLWLLSVGVWGQEKQIDRLEMFYDQGYYGKVLRKSRKLQANPEYDYTSLPSFYESMSLFRLAVDPYWRKRHKTAIDDAIGAYNRFLQNDKAPDYLNQHYYEIASLKVYLYELKDQLIEKGQRVDGQKVADFIREKLMDIDERPLTTTPDIVEDSQNDSPTAKTNRDKIVAYAKKYLGVQYLYAGSDEKGFDCSGFTSYVYRKFGILLPRTATGQQEKAKTVKVASAQKGDLVFFGPGSKITHVGLVVSDKGDELTMIHASSSKGVIITNIEQSTYWNPKLKGAGTYL